MPVFLGLLPKLWEISLGDRASSGVCLLKVQLEACWSFSGCSDCVLGDKIPQSPVGSTLVSSEGLTKYGVSHLSLKGLLGFPVSLGLPG